jgi:hypothetical protein
MQKTYLVVRNVNYIVIHVDKSFISLDFTNLNSSQKQGDKSFISLDFTNLNSS